MITCSIVTYNTALTELTSFLNCIIPTSISKIYIIDNSEIDSLRIVLQLSNKIEYEFGHGNIGFGAAHNIAIQKAFESSSDYHIVSNSDIIFNPHIIKELEFYMELNKSVGLVTPKILYPNGELQYLCKLLPTPIDWISRRFLSFSRLFYTRNRVFELRDSGYNKIMKIPYLSGCFMFFRCRTLKEIGLFDTNIFMYGEDTDITRRIYEKYDTIFFPHVSIYHIHRKESHKNFKLLIIHLQAAVYYFNKWGWFFDKKRKIINKEVKNKYL